MLTPTKPVKSCECSSPCGDCCGCTKESIGLGNVDNTSDLNKPLSTAMINALSGKVDLDTFTQLKNRVLALENSMPDITDLEHRMDEAEDDILGLNAGYTALHNTVLSMADSITELGGRVTGVSDALVTLDTNTVKLRGQSEQTIEGKLKANDPSAGATDKTLVTANWISQTGNSSPNNLLHRYGNETKYGEFIQAATFTLCNEGWQTIPTIVFKQANLDSTIPPTAYKALGGGFTIRDSNNRIIWQYTAYRDTNGRDVFNITGSACDGSSGYFHFELGPNNYRKIATNFDKPGNW